MNARVAVLLLLFLLCGIGKSQKRYTPRTKQEKIGYSIGVRIAQDMKSQGLGTVDQKFLMQGMKDVLADTTIVLSESEIDSTMNVLQREAEAALKEQQNAEGEKNRREGEAFLAENRTKDGVITLPSGLQYRILRTGTGPMPTIGQKAKCHYKGMFINGKEFENSYNAGMPVEILVGGREIKGWNEALQRMPVGSIWELYIPSSLAYGERGAQPIIGQNVTIILDVELLSVEAAAMPAPTQNVMERTGGIVGHIDRILYDFCIRNALWIYMALFMLLLSSVGTLAVPYMPADSLLFAVGTLGAIDALNLGYLVLAATAATIAGVNVSYWIGRRAGKEIPGRARPRFFNRNHFERAHRLYAEQGETGVLLACFIPLVRAYVPFVVGTEGLGYGKFLLLSAVGAAAWANVVIVIGYCLSSIPFIRENFSIAVAVVFLVPCIPAAVKLARGLKGRRTGNHRPRSGA